jgi:anti-anti-sigma factor
MADNVRVVKPQGRLDSNTSPAFEKQLLSCIEGGSRRVLLDFSELQYVSSAGLRSVLLGSKRMRAAGGSLALCSLNAQIAEVFQISGFDTILDIHASAEAAMKHLLAS